MSELTRAATPMGLNTAGQQPSDEQGHGHRLPVPLHSPEDVQSQRGSAITTAAQGPHLLPREGATGSDAHTGKRGKAGGPTGDVRAP